MIILRSILIAVAFLFALNVVSAQEKKRKGKEEQVVFSVNMHCENCEKRIKKNIPYEKGVNDLTTDLNKHLVTIKYKTAKTNKDNLKMAIEKLGYTCEEVKDKIN